MNPEIFFPTSSIVGIVWAGVLLFILPFLFYCKRKRWFLLVLAILPGLVLLLFSNSRSGWLGFAAGALFFAGMYFKGQQRKPILVIALISFFIFFLVLLQYKSNSSAGRIYIYSLSIKILKENWLKGIGIGKFKAEFNQYQADYFSKNSIDNERALLADNTFYAFNEYLQWTIETGITGFLLLIIAIWLLLRRANQLLKVYGNKPIVIGSTSSLICIAVAAFFNYPMHAIPIQAMTLFCIGIILFYPLKISDKTKDLNIPINVFRIIFIAGSSFFSLNSFLHIKSKLSEKKAFELQRAGYKAEAIKKYEKLIYLVHLHGYNFYFYAERLYYANRLTEAEEAIANCQRHYTDNKVYKLKAQIETELGKYKDAEESYLRAIYMVPNRMGSRYDIMNFYISLKDTAMAMSWANSILNMPVKVPSDRTENMLKATRQILKKLKH